MEISFVSKAMQEAFENSDFYDLGYNNQCDNYCDMYNNGRNALYEAFNSALSERLPSMTNGDVIKVIFDVTDVRQLDYCVFVDTSDDAILRFYKDWWNAPYKKLS